MPEPGQLNVNDRVLLHLSRFASDIPPETHPQEATQAGIAAAVGISRTHVPRAVKNLMKDGLAEECQGRVEGHERRMSVYIVTAEGLRRAEELWTQMADVPLSVMTGDTKATMSGKQIEERLGKKGALAAVSRMRDGVVRVDDKRRAPVRALKGAPAPEQFCGREEELRLLDRFMDSDARVAVVLASKGFGATALARRFAEEQDEMDLLWMTISPSTTVNEIEANLKAFAAKVDPKAPDALDLPNALIVFDDYFSVSEEVVEFFGSIMEAHGSTKMLVTAREEMPAYDWFYRKRHVDAGVVEVLRVKGLDERGAMRLLGNERIDPEAFMRVFRMTRGQPMALRMLREGDAGALKKNTVFTSEEIKYLLLLKDKKR